MKIKLSDLALSSLWEILNYYEIEAGESIPKSEIFPDTRKLVISRLPYVAFIRQIDGNVWEVVDIVHTSRKLPKN